jgi:prepilin-type N-terminal cleavage/methylation domain-containing protein
MILYNNKNRFGFALIELLVVIAIIGLLSSVVLANIQGIKAKARDAKRQQDLREIHMALELLYNEIGSYIDSTELCFDSSIGGGLTVCNPPSPPANDWAANSNLRTLVNRGYIGVLPIDPINNATYYYYFEPNADDQGNCRNFSWAASCEFTLCVTRLETTGRRWCHDSFGVGSR